MTNATFLEVFCDSSTTGLGIYCPQLGVYIGEKYPHKVKVNEGEFLAINKALTVLLKNIDKIDLQYAGITVYTDSKNAFRALKYGIDVVHAENLLPIAEQNISLFSKLFALGFEMAVHHIKREYNTNADKLSHGIDPIKGIKLW